MEDDIYHFNCTFILHRIDSSLKMKIADFGLSRDIHESEYYRSNDLTARLPVKWMAPESLAEQVFDDTTDVVRYGAHWQLKSNI